jgi:predicted DCC family thiol-disulfide oxidoreductase YuxK
VEYKTTMFYDGGCPVCLRGVRHYQRMDWARRLRWVDITRDPSNLDAIGVDFPTAMEHLCVRDRRGQLQIGMPAFVALWRELPVYRYLARLMDFPGLLLLCDGLYRRMTRGRYRRRCHHDACGTP